MEARARAYLHQPPKILADCRDAVTAPSLQTSDIQFIIHVGSYDRQKNSETRSLERSLMTLLHSG
jgi:hypothetical protein